MAYVFVRQAAMKIKKRFAKAVMLLMAVWTVYQLMSVKNVILKVVGS